jgi:hypothetical protein
MPREVLIFKFNGARHVTCTVDQHPLQVAAVKSRALNRCRLKAEEFPPGDYCDSAQGACLAVKMSQGKALD